MTLLSNKSAFKTYCEAHRLPNGYVVSDAIETFFAADASINLVHPFNEQAGPLAYKNNFFTPLRNAFDGLKRSEYMAFGGGFEQGDWVTCSGYYHGNFTSSWLGIQPTGGLAYLRFGEFHRMQNGKAIESYIFLDIPELMIATGQWPITDSPGSKRGYTGYLPGPATQDGLIWRQTDPKSSAQSFQIVTDMLQGLATKNQAWRPYWHDDMLWYGPAAFGSFVGLKDFAGFQLPFENAFSEWIGGASPGSQTRHFTRFADGDYVCSGGWPSLNAVQAKTFLGQPAKGERLFMRVCDWWRRDGDLLVENWVMVDIPHVLLQMGYDLFGQLNEPAA
jgi:hypothetical protein